MIRIIGRAVKEWIGKTPETRPPDRIRDRVLERYGRVCHWSGRPIGPGDDWDVDHIKPLGLGGENRESNLAPILRGAPHKEKTKKEVDMMRKADRIRRKNNGTWKRKGRKIPSRPFYKPEE